MTSRTSSTSTATALRSSCGASATKFPSNPALMGRSSPTAYRKSATAKTLHAPLPTGWIIPSACSRAVWLPSSTSQASTTAPSSTTARTRSYRRASSSARRPARQSVRVACISSPWCARVWRSTPTIRLQATTSSTAAGATSPKTTSSVRKITTGAWASSSGRVLTTLASPHLITANGPATPPSSVPWT